MTGKEARNLESRPMSLANPPRRRPPIILDTPAAASAVFKPLLAQAAAHVHIAFDQQTGEYVAPDSNALLKKLPKIAVDLEGEALGPNGRVGVITVALSDSSVYIFDVSVLGKDAFTPGLCYMREVLEEPRITKVLFDVRMDTAALYFLHDVRCRGMIDLQVCVARRFNRDGFFLMGLDKALTRLGLFSDADQDAKARGKKLFDPQQGGSYQLWFDRPIPKEALNYCVVDVKHFFRALRMFREESIREAWQLAEARTHAITTGPRPSAAEEVNGSGPWRDFYLLPNDRFELIDAKILRAHMEQWEQEQNEKDEVPVVQPLASSAPPQWSFATLGEIFAARGIKDLGNNKKTYGDLYIKQPTFLTQEEADDFMRNKLIRKKRDFNAMATQIVLSLTPPPSIMSENVQIMFESFPDEKEVRAEEEKDQIDDEIHSTEKKFSFFIHDHLTFNSFAHANKVNAPHPPSLSTLGLIYTCSLLSSTTIAVFFYGFQSNRRFKLQNEQHR